MAISKQQAEALIRQTAQEAGAADLADVLVATSIQETGLDIYVPGDNNRSWGPFHEYDEGRGAGLTIAQRQDVPGATRRAIAEFRTMQKRYPNASPGELAVYAQRPAQQYRPGYIAAVNKSVQQMASGKGNQVNGLGGASRRRTVAGGRRSRRPSSSAPPVRPGCRPNRAGSPPPGAAFGPFRGARSATSSAGHRAARRG